MPASRTKRFETNTSYEEVLVGQYVPHDYLENLVWDYLAMGTIGHAVWSKLGLEYFRPRGGTGSSESVSIFKTSEGKISELKAFFNPLKVLSLGALLKPYTIVETTGLTEEPAQEQLAVPAVGKSSLTEDTSKKKNKPQISLQGMKGGLSQEAYTLFSGVGALCQNRLTVERGLHIEELSRLVKHEDKSRQVRFMRSAGLEYLSGRRELRGGVGARPKIKTTYAPTAFEGGRLLQTLSLTRPLTRTRQKVPNTNIKFGPFKNNQPGVGEDTKALTPKRPVGLARQITLSGVSQKFCQPVRSLGLGLWEDTLVRRLSKVNSSPKMKIFDLVAKEVPTEPLTALSAVGGNLTIKPTFQQSEIFAAKYLKYYKTYRPSSSVEKIPQTRKAYKPLWKRKINNNLWKKVPIVGPHRKYLLVQTNETNLKYFNHGKEKRWGELATSDRWPHVPIGGEKEKYPYRLLRRKDKLKTILQRKLKPYYFKKMHIYASRKKGKIKQADRRFGPKFIKYALKKQHPVFTNYNKKAYGTLPKYDLYRESFKRLLSGESNLIVYNRLAFRRSSLEHAIVRQGRRSHPPGVKKKKPKVLPKILKKLQNRLWVQRKLEPYVRGIPHRSYETYLGPTPSGLDENLLPLLMHESSDRPVS